MYWYRNVVFTSNFSKKKKKIKSDVFNFASQSNLKQTSEYLLSKFE